MAKPNKFILGYLDKPETWNKAAFETAIRSEVEMSTGALTASDQLLIGSLTLTVDSLVASEIKIRNEGLIFGYSGGSAPAGSPYYKIRTEMIDKAIKLLAELGLVARGRPKMKPKTSDVDALFASA